MPFNIVSALERKHRALAEEMRGHFAQVADSRDAVGTLRALDPDISRLRSELEALEVSLKSFAPAWSASESYRRPRTKRSPFPKGQLRSHIMAILREGEKAWTQADLFDEIIKRHVGQRLDHRDRGNLQVGVRGHLKRDLERGLLERTEDPERWRLIRKSERAATKPAPASKAASAV